ncbi:DUF4253 domain-containing protein [Streptomyces sp. NPDC059248]|uniref:DUF4253 domain-containing protein n=1 Tax=Streptomyces sp. NPDC059248 TaxID=3346791 RepID=UPI0036ACE0F0
MNLRPLPAELHPLFPPGGADERRLSAELPAGRVIRSDEREGGAPVLWLGDGPATAAAYARFRADHARSGLQPLLLDALDPDDDAYRPWACGELFPPKESGGERDPAAVLAEWWRGHTGVADGDEAEQDDDERFSEVFAPFGTGWPGLAPAPAPAGDPGRLADALARELLAMSPWLRLGLVAAPSAAAALTVAGWSGPVNMSGDITAFSAVLDDWERRFGARVVAVGFATLRLSVAAPPVGREAALALAAEHFAFCPDNIWQGAGSVGAYAEAIDGMREWYFWWD